MERDHGAAMEVEELLLYLINYPLTDVVSGLVRQTYSLFPRRPLAALLTSPVHLDMSK